MLNASKRSKQMTYKTFSIAARFGDFVKFFEFTAVDLEAACNDIREAYGEFELVQYGTR
jgi:hypothetical protein